MGTRIERLDARHDRQGFACGNAALDEFLRQHAGQQQRKGFGKTYVALEDDSDQVVGFVTLSAGQIAAVDLPESAKLPHHPAPVLRIGRLAVDLTAQGKGVAQDLLAHALHVALQFSAQVGIYAVVVDAKHEQAAAFYRRLGFIALLDNPLCLFLPLHTLRQTQ